MEIKEYETALKVFREMLKDDTRKMHPGNFAWWCEGKLNEKTELEMPKCPMTDGSEHECHAYNWGKCMNAFQCKPEPETKRLERTKYRDCCVTCNDWNKMCDYLESKHGTLEYTEPKQ